MNNFKLNEISITDYEGNGQPLIFVHAYPLCSRMWDEQVSYFKEKYRVITYDIRGLGYSNELKDYLFTMEELVNDFFNIMDHLKLEKVNACGLSMGGYILLRALVRDQHRFNSVILADTKSESDNNDALLGRSNTIIKIKSGKKDEFSAEFLKKLLSENAYKNEKTREFVRMIMGWMDVKGLCSAMIAIATRTNIFYQLKDIKTPALVIVGRKDILTPVINSFYLKEGLDNSVFKVIEDAGHLSNLEKPAEFNKSVEEFLSNLKNNIMNNSLSKYSDFGMLFLRIGVGIIFIFIHGLSKITAGPEMWTRLGSSMSNFGINFLPEFWGFMAAFTEFFVPMFLILGFLFRPATFLLTFNMIVATSVHLKNLDPWGRIAYPMLLVILFISMFIMGPGRYSIDQFLKNRKH